MVKVINKNDRACCLYLLCIHPTLATVIHRLTQPKPAIRFTLLDIGERVGWESHPNSPEILFWNPLRKKSCTFKELRAEVGYRERMM